MPARDHPPRARLGSLAWMCVAAVALGACTHWVDVQPPPGWVPRLRDRVSGRDAFGSWCALRLQRGSARREVSGELIAAVEDSIYVLEREGLVAVPTTRITAASVTEYTYSNGAPRTTLVAQYEWMDLAPYARFPQGPPPGVDLRALRPKPAAGR